MKAEEWETLRYSEELLLVDELENQTDRVLLYGYDLLSRYHDPEKEPFVEDRVYIVTLSGGVIHRYKIEGDETIDYLAGVEWPAWMLAPDVSVLSAESDFEFVKLLIDKRVIIKLAHSQSDEERRWFARALAAVEARNNVG